MNFNVYLLVEVLQNATEGHKEGGQEVDLKWSKITMYFLNGQNGFSTYEASTCGGMKEQTEGDLGSVGGLKNRLKDE